MRVFLYEYVTGGGMWSQSPATPPSGSLLAEGSAMIVALATDLARIPGVRVAALRDCRLAGLALPDCDLREIAGADEQRQAIEQLSAQADWTVLIAPEFGGILLDRCRQVTAAGGRLLSPGPDLVELASDKHRTALQLARGGVPTPYALLLPTEQPLPVDFPYPAVAKPRAGAGSLGVQWVSGPDAEIDRTWLGREMRLERYCPGTAASISVLCGPNRHVLLPACRQRLSDDGHFRYLGGETPLPEAMRRRAARLAAAVVETLPAAVGYWGIDLVLGHDDHQDADVVIEINPRLTTSYIALRRLARENLAEAMLALAEGRPFELSFANQRIEFAVDAAIDNG